MKKLNSDKILILLDMNETMILRTHKKIKCPTKPNISNAKFIYFRPGYHKLLEPILSHPKCTVGIYSSMIMKNCKLCTLGLLSHPNLQKFTINFLFNREYNVKDPEGIKKSDTMRDLNKIWEFPPFKNQYGPKNTIMIDNEIRKARNCLENSIVVDSFIEEHLINGHPNNNYYCEILGIYLKNLLDNYEGDIRNQLKNNPFKIEKEKYFTKDNEIIIDSIVIILNACL